MFVRYMTLGLAVLLALLINLNHQQDQLHHGLLALDDDGYWHLLRVQNMHQGDWDNEINERGNAPFGERIHWTSAFDLVLLTGAKIGSLFTDFDSSLHWTGVVVGPFFFVVSVMMLLLFGREILGPEKGVLPAILFAIDPYQSQSIFSVCRPDHHCFVSFLFILYYCSFMLLISRPDRTALAIWTGIAGALGIWAGLEILVLVGLSVVYLGSLWILQGEQYAKINLSLTASLSVGLLVTLLAEEKAANYLNVTYDKRSIVHLTLFILVFLYWAAVNWLNKVGVDRGGRFRLLFAIAGGSFLIAVLLSLFPDLLTGPLTSVNPDFYLLYLKQTGEFGTDEEVLRHYLLAIPSVVYLSYVVSRASHKMRLECTWLLLILCAYALLGSKMYRWLFSLQVLCIFPNAMILGSMLEWKSSLKNTVAAFGFCLVLLIGPHLSFAQPAKQTEIAEAKGNYWHQVVEILAIMESRDHTKNREIVLANIYLGPLIMYRSSFDVVGTPNHNNESGVLDTYRIMNASDAETARSLIQARGIDFVLLDPQLIQFARIPLESSNSKNEQKFMDRLIDGSHPEWLMEVSLPESLTGGFRLFRVRESQTGEPEGDGLKGARPPSI